ncbi:MAG: alpha/beta hydrolase family protein [Gaiellales bacterium]
MSTIAARPAEPRAALRARLVARRRALVLIAVVLDVPLAARVVRGLTGEPAAEEVEVGGVPVEIVRPAGRGPWPAYLFVNGAHPERRREPVVTRLSRGLARAGFIALVPDLPGLGEGEITCGTLDATVAVADAAARMPDVRGGRVALVGASTGASLAILAAGRPELAPRISVVAAVTPFADLEKIVCLATTCSYEEEGDAVAYPVTPLLRRAVARSLVASLPAGDDRESLLARLRGLDEDADPLERLEEEVGGLGLEAEAVVRLLTNRDPARFRELFAALPAEVLSVVSVLSPATAAAGLLAPVEVIVPPSDVYFPRGEASRLAEALPSVRLTVTSTLDHTRPALSLSQLEDFRSFGGFVVRGLAAAAS